MMDIPASPGAPYGREREERERSEGQGQVVTGVGKDRAGRWGRRSR